MPGDDRAAPAPEAWGWTPFLAAALHWRLRWLLSRAGPDEARALRLLPALMHYSFPLQGLRDEPPGVLRATAAARRLGAARPRTLPPPCGTRRGRPLLAGIVVVASRDALEVLAVPAEGAASPEAAGIRDRLRAAVRVLEAGPRPLRPWVADRARPFPGLDRLLHFGAVLAGRPGAVPCAAATERPEWDWAPDGCARLALGLFASDLVPTADAAALAMRRGMGARALADPDLVAVLRAGTSGPRLAHLARVLGWTTKDPRTAAACRELLRSQGERLGGPSSAADVAQTGRALVLDAARVAAGLRAPERAAARRCHAQLAPGDGLPGLLVPLMRAATGPVLRTTLRRAGARWEACEASGLVLGAGPTQGQARLRALALASRLRVRREGVLADEACGAGERLALRVLAAVPARRTLVLEVKALPMGGPPFDPLNRGPQRALALAAATVRVLDPGRRPAVRPLDPEHAVRELAREAGAGTRVLVVADEPDAQPAVARLQRLAQRVAAGRPLAIEVAGRVWLTGTPAPRAWTLTAFGARPCSVPVDPEAPDLGAGPEGVPLPGPSSVLCDVLPAAPQGFALVWRDASRAWLREVVEEHELRDTLEDARALLWSALGTAVLVHASPETPRAPGAAEGPAAPVRLVFGRRGRLAVAIGGELFGTDAGLGWDAAAQALLSLWPPGVSGRVSLREAEGPVPGPLMLLHGRSVARRRLSLHVRRALRTRGPAF